MAAQTSVVIVNWNGDQFLEPLLRSLRDAKPNSIVAVDNASTDRSQEILSKHPELQSILNESNAGFGKAANQGIDVCASPYILLLNADVEVLAGSINRLQKFLEENPSVAAVAPQLVFPNGTIQPSCRSFPTLPKMFCYLSFLDRMIPTGYKLGKDLHQQTREVDQPMGAALMIRKDVLDQVGRFDERFFLYMEDVDLCERIRRAGYQIYLLPEARMIHHAGGSSNQEWERSQRNYLQSVIRYFQKRNLSPVLVKLTLSFALSFRTLFLVLSGEWRKARFYGKMVRGVFFLS
jgi:GT2 family glycosyltransferase